MIFKRLDSFTFITKLEVKILSFIFQTFQRRNRTKAGWSINTSDFDLRLIYQSRGKESKLRRRQELSVDRTA